MACLAYNPDRSGMLAAGAYSGVAALYDAASLAPMALLPDGHRAGITQASTNDLSADVKVGICSGAVAIQEP